MAKIPVYAGAGPIQGPSTVAPANLQAVTNEAIGQGLQTVSKELSRVEEMSKRAGDVKHLASASISMSQAQADFAKYQQENPNEEEWLKYWQETVGKVEGSIADMPLTPDARARLSENFSAWSTRGTINVQAEAFRQAGRNALLTVDTAAKVGRMTGDFTPAKEAVSNLRASGLVSPEEAQNLEVGVAADERQYQRSEYDTMKDGAMRKFDGVALVALADKAKSQGLLSPAEYSDQIEYARQIEGMGTFREMAIANPVIAKAQLKTDAFGVLTPIQRQQAEQFVESTLRDYQMRERSEIADRITNGDDLSNYKFKWIMDDTSQAKIRSEAMQRPPTLAQAAAMRLGLEAAIGKYSLDADPDRTQMISISAQVEAMKKAVPYAYSDLATTWATKKGGGGNTVADMEIADNAAYLAKLFKPRFDALLDRKGNIKSGKEEEFRRLQAEATNLQQQYKLRIGSNPTPEEARKVSRDILTVPTSEATVDYFRAYDGAENPLLTPTIDSSDLPTTTW